LIDSRRQQHYGNAEVNRPVFTHLATPMNQICRYIAFSKLRDAVSKAGSMIKYLRPEFLDDIAEDCDVYQDD
jgi:hypothetical protein